MTIRKMSFEKIAIWEMSIGKKNWKNSLRKSGIRRNVIQKNLQEKGNRKNVM